MTRQLLDVPTSGTAKVTGQSYRDMPAPLSEIGAMLDAGATHPGRSARDHLEATALTHGIAARRGEQVIDVAGLSGIADRRAEAFSLGMAQRLGIASALLGDPGTLVLDPR